MSSNNIEPRVEKESIGIGSAATQENLAKLKSSQITIKEFMEKYLVIKTKTEGLKPFKFNRPQNRLYNLIKKLDEEGRPKFILILKSRQMGFSTFVEGFGCTNTILNANTNFGIITHKEDATRNLFAMTERFLAKLPNGMRPEEVVHNSGEIKFNNKEGNGLDSQINCMTATPKGVGRGYTFNIVHASEYAFWEGDKNQILTDLLQAVPDSSDTVVIIESTANGYDDFKEMWDQANAIGEDENDWAPFFAGWNELDEYKRKYNGFKLTDYERELMLKYKLTLEQISWRRFTLKNKCKSDLNKFMQEYPICPEEAFIASGNSAFNINNINARLALVKKPIKVGKFSYQMKFNYDNNTRSLYDTKFVEDEKGYVLIYKDVEVGHPYIIGGDTAGEGSDYSVLQVIDNSTGEQVCVLRSQKIDEDLLADQAYCLGLYYNYALIGIEVNISLTCTNKLAEYGYENLYVREQIDSITQKLEEKVGFKTTVNVRNPMLDLLTAIMRETPELINDRQTLLEMQSFNYIDGKRQALAGKHDDCVISLAIAYKIRESGQQTTLISKEPYFKTREKNFFFDDDEDDSEQYYTGGGYTIR